mgnify:FL=1
MWPILFSVGSFEMGSYGVMLVVAAFAALGLAVVLGRRDGFPSKQVVDIGVFTLFAGIAGTKILGVIVQLATGVPFTLADLRTAGAVHGGLLGGLIGIVLLARYYKLSLPLLTDTYAPAAALGIAIGRIGCFLAGCCFGTESHLPWAVTYTDPAAVTLGGVTLGIPLHPVQLYDTLAHVLVCLVLVTLHRKNLLRGALVGPWCILEGLTRFSVESFRGDLGRGVWFEISWLSTGRVTAILLVVIGVALLAFRDKWKPPAATALA